MFAYLGNSTNDKIPERSMDFPLNTFLHQNYSHIIKLTYTIPPKFMLLYSKVKWNVFLKKNAWTRQAKPFRQQNKRLMCHVKFSCPQFIAQKSPLPRQTILEPLRVKSRLQTFSDRATRFTTINLRCVITCVWQFVFVNFYKC